MALIAPNSDEVGKRSRQEGDQQGLRREDASCAWHALHLRSSRSLGSLEHTCGILRYAPGYPRPNTDRALAKEEHDMTDARVAVLAALVTPPR
jgi:hypothetical protein